MFGKVYKSMKDADFFGYQVRLNFNKNGEAHNTFIGGVFSILIRIMMLGYIINLFDKMISYGGDNNKSVEMAMQESKPIILQDSNVKFYIQFQNISDGFKSIKYDDQLKKCVRVQVTEIESLNFETWPNINQHALKELDPKNFPNETLKNGTSLSMVANCLKKGSTCYEIDLNRDVKIQETFDSSIQRRFGFGVNRCTEGNHTGCHQDKDIIEDKISDIVVVIDLFYDQLDFSKKNGKPVKSKKEQFTFTSLNSQSMLWNNAQLRTNQVQTSDSWFSFLLPPPTTQYFYDIAVNNRQTINQKGPMKMYLYRMDITEYKGGYMLHTREAYGILNLIGDLGGVLDLFILFIGLFLYPVAEHSFNIKAINKLLSAHSKNLKDYISFGTISKNDLKERLKLNINFSNSMLLYIMNNYCCCFQPCLKQKKAKKRKTHYIKLQKIYDEGIDKMEDQLNIERILKALASDHSEFDRVDNIELDNSSDENVKIDLGTQKSDQQTEMKVLGKTYPDQNVNKLETFNGLMSQQNSLKNNDFNRISKEEQYLSAQITTPRTKRSGDEIT